MAAPENDLDGVVFHAQYQSDVATNVRDGEREEVRLANRLVASATIDMGDSTITALIPHRRGLLAAACQIGIAAS